MTKTLTIDSVLALRPCDDYTRERLAELSQGRDDWTIEEVLAREDIPAADRIWLFCQPGVVSDAQRAAWLDVVVTRAVRTHALTCGVPAVEKWAQSWLSGEDRSRAAAEAAERAVWAAWSAARAAARAAAAAEWAATEWAAGAAAAAGDRTLQIADALAVLKGARS